MNDLLSSGNIPGLFPPEDMDDIINNVRPPSSAPACPTRARTAGTCFINTGARQPARHPLLLAHRRPDQVRTRRFPALVNCVVIDWFQPWPEEALTSVSKRFLDDVDLGEPRRPRRTS